KLGHLYTVKSVEKQRILKTKFATQQWWVGLDDIVTEGTFRWADDNTTSNMTWLRTIFDTGAGQPDNSRGGEDCVRTYWTTALMYDVSCSLNTPYISPNCLQPVDRGTCTGNYIRYYYNKNTGSCQQFTYSGCGGNYNRFNSLDQCRKSCKWS
ncbi:U-actitoxin-Avd3l, partial [Bulinus truncatus]